MDFYQKDPTTLRRLLTKRQNPCTQIFKTQPSNPTNGPMPAINLSRNDIFASHEERNSAFNPQSMADNIIPSINISQSQSQSSHTTPSTYDDPSNMTTQIEEDDDEDAPILDNVQKKIKTTLLTTKSDRRPSYEEEKEECEQHSTSCETRSDFNIGCESVDFLLSPSMSHLPSKNLTEIKLDGNDGTPQHETFSLNLNYDGSSHLDENLDFLKLLSSSKQKVKCKLNHQCEVEVGRSCPRCADLLHECKEFARKNEGSCLNEEYDETIRYRCIKGHCWTLNHKNARRRWCAQCSKEQRAFLKKKCEEEKIERERQEEENQKKLFEEAKKKAMKDNGKPQQPFGFAGTNTGYGSQRPMSTLEYFQRIDYEIESLAKKYTLEFMSQKTFNGEISFQQILQVYKIVIMPEEILQTYMFNLNADTLRSEFRRMAKIIHPDKNKHPQAGNAFQKIYKVYEIALSRFEGTQQKI